MPPDMDSDSSSPLSSVPASPPSSPLSSLASLSPSPPPEMRPHCAFSAPYPSPPASQQTSQTGSPIPDGMESGTNTDKYGFPPAKRRKLSKERTTESLDLRSSGVDPDQQRQLDRLLNVLHKRQKIVVIAGAGISVSAGIPDFRSSQGLFRSLKDEYNLKGSGKHLFDASVYKDDVSTSSFHDMVSTMSRLTKSAKPTAFHHMLATIAQEDRLLRLYSQNVDGIDTALEPLKTSVPLRKESDGKWPRTVQLHGGLDKMVCSKCRELSDLDPRLFTGPVPPLCPRCEEINDIRTNHEGKRSHGIGRLRPRMVLYNEHNPDDEAIGTVTKEDLRKRPDAVIVVGTTLKVPGVRRIVREMCATVRDRRGGVTIWINNDPPPVAKDLEDCWDIVVQGTSDEVARHAAMRKWNEPQVPHDFVEVSEEDARKATEKALLVQLSTPKCPMEYAPAISLPSSLHKNNSFRPPEPCSTPRKILERSPEWSPMGTPPCLILESIERETSGRGSSTLGLADTVPVNPSLTLTPSKSGRSTPAKREVHKKQQASIKDKLKGKSKLKEPITKATKKTAPSKTTKRTNVKYVKPAQSQKKTQAKAKAQSGPRLNFKSSKAASLGTKTSKNDLTSPAKSPSKLRQQAYMSSSPSEPMVPLPPQHLKNNTSPTNVVGIWGNKPVHPVLGQSENPASDYKRNRMSVSHIMN